MVAQTANASHSAASTKGPAKGPLWRIVLLSLVLVTTLTSCDLGLGGSTGLGSYNCVNMIGGCYNGLVLSVTHLGPKGKPDLPTDLDGAVTDLLLVPLSCDTACRDSSGPGNPPGYIANFLVLRDDTTGAFIRVGYMTTTSGTNHYFMQYYLPDIATIPNLTKDFGPTGIDPGFAGSSPYTEFWITHSFEQFWFIWIVPLTPDAHPTGGQEYSEEIGPTLFRPTQIRYVQLIWGRSGAVAPLAVFTNNYYRSYFANPNPPYDVVVSADGVPFGPGGTPSQPTLAQWLNPPSNASNGGAFAVQCC
jgi:hypothetical protein